MATKFYLHRNGNDVAGTLPAPTATASTSTPTWTPGVSNGSGTTPLLQNLRMDAVIGTAQISNGGYTTAASTANQQQPYMRFISDPITAQTIASQQITVQLGFANSNAASVFQWTW